MHVGLEVRTDALISELATDKDDMFEEVLSAARARLSATDQSMIDLFIDEFESRDPDARLSRYFRNAERDITRRSTNAEIRSEEHTSELQSRGHLVCRLLLEKKKRS